MNSVLDFFYNMLSTSDWPPRWFCGYWSDFHGWLTIISDLLIWLAYFFIPVILVKLTQSQKSIPFLPVFWLFGSFIILCGFTHLMDAIIFWWPAYRLGTFIKLLTAIVSLGTVWALLKVLPQIINFEDDDLVINEKDQKVEELERKAADLSKQVLEKENEIDRMKLEIAQLKNNSI